MQQNGQTWAIFYAMPARKVHPRTKPASKQKNGMLPGHKGREKKQEGENNTQRDIPQRKQALSQNMRVAPIFSPISQSCAGPIGRSGMYSDSDCDG